MTFELAAGRNNLPIFSKTSSFTRLAGGNNDPYQALKNQSRGIDELALHPARVSLYKLLLLDEDWDGFGSLRPDPYAIKKAFSLIGDIYRSALETRLPWVQPHITSSEEGEVVFEWWSGFHKLTLYISSNGSCEFVQVWGSDMHSQMRHGTLAGEQFQGLWRWLLSLV